MRPTTNVAWLHEAAPCVILCKRAGIRVRKAVDENGTKYCGVPSWLVLIFPYGTGYGQTYKLKMAARLAHQLYHDVTFRLAAEAAALAGAGMLQNFLAIHDNQPRRVRIHPRGARARWPR